MRSIGTRLSALMLVVMLWGCAALNPNFQEPEVNVTSFKLVPGNSLSPTFEIGLRVLNPNNTALNLNGLSYNARIKGNKVFSGVANDLPTIPAYGEEDIKLTAKADLFGGLGLITDLLKEQKAPITYQLQVKIDLQNFLLPINITREGNLTLPGIK
jgi:LEA14-like dessication related protein